MNVPYPIDADQARRLHLSHLLDHASASSTEIQTFPASFVKPNTYWSSEEKASFFASLTHRSRWRPDLISEDIGGGKAVADVCSYIELLEQGSARRPRIGHIRNMYPTAHEVSEDWISVENEIAAELCAKDGERQKAALKRTRSVELKAVRQSLRRSTETTRKKTSKAYAESNIPPSPKRDCQMLDRAESEAWKERFDARKQALTGLWKREDFLSSLDGRFLKTMDTMLLRTLEHSEADKTMQEGDQLGLEDTGPEQDGGAQLNVDAPSSEARLQFTSNPDRIDLQIDPVLLALDTGVAVPAPGPSQVRDSERDIHSLHTPSSVMDHISRSVSPSSPPVAEISHTLSPASRRRLRKRLWARRQRAMEKGLPTSEVSLESVKLKCGPKAKPKTHEGVPAKEEAPGTQTDMNHSDTSSFISQPTPSQISPRSKFRGAHANQAEDEDEAMDDLESFPARRPYGWSKLKARQVSGLMLRTDGMDLFHLEKFANLTSLLGHVHTLFAEADPFSEAGAFNERPSRLSYPLLRLLRAYVVRFVTCLVANVILNKDMETRQKRRIRKIFETGGVKKIRSANVHEALLHMGRDASTKQLFMRLKGTFKRALTARALSQNRHCSDPRADESEEMESSDDGSTTEETEDDETSSMGTHSVRFSLASQQAVSPPCDDPKGPCLSIWNPSMLSTSGRMVVDSLLSERMVRFRWDKELKAEEKVEEVDRETDRIHERELWRELGVERVELNEPVKKVSANETNVESRRSETVEQPRVMDTKAKASRSLKSRRRRGTAKSRVYIDSDEDL